MRRNTKLVFTKREDRPPLDPAEVRYQRAMLRKVLKIGNEYESNLKENKGTCSGDAFICPCSHPDKEKSKCYEKCLVSNSCKLKKTYDCPGIYCVEFISPCQNCNDAVRDCSRCELFDDPKKRPNEVRNKLTSILKPTNDLSIHGDHGTFQVVKDNSLLGDGGIEVTTVGRKVSYDALYKQAKYITEQLKKHGAYVNERTSIHIHLVAGYFALETDKSGKIKVKYKKGGYTGKHYIDELERSVPEIVLVNFHQLVRRYHNAITWISSSGDTEKHLTRWMKFRMPILKYSPIQTSMQSIRNQLGEVDGHQGKYSFMNYTNTMFKNNNDIKRLHIEGRFCDGMLSPSAVASLNILMYSLMIKAVSLSQYGILHAGDQEYMQQAYEIQKTLLNNNGSYQGSRFSKTHKFEPYREIVRAQAADMVNLLRSELRYHGPASRILQQLAEMPCSMRRIRGDDWDKIEKDLSGKKEKNVATRNHVLEIVDSLYIDDCLNIKEWVDTVGEELKIDKDTADQVVTDLLKTHDIAWDGTMGTFLRC